MHACHSSSNPNGYNAIIDILVNIIHHWNNEDIYMNSCPQRISDCLPKHWGFIFLVLHAPHILRTSTTVWYDPTPLSHPWIILFFWGKMKRNIRKFVSSLVPKPCESSQYPTTSSSNLGGHFLVVHLWGFLFHPFCSFMEYGIMTMPLLKPSGAAAVLMILAGPEELSITDAWQRPCY